MRLRRQYDAAGNWNATQSVAANASPLVQVSRMGFMPKGFTWANGIVESLKFDALGEGLERTAKLGPKTVSTWKVLRNADGVQWRRDSTTLGASSARTVGRDTFGRLTHELVGDVADAPGSQPTAAKLATATTGLWETSFDAANNPQSLGGGVTALGVHNQLTTALGDSLKYDAAGRLTRIGKERFSYDPFGRLASSEGPLGRWSFRYDANSILMGWEREAGRAKVKAPPGAVVLPLTSGEFVRVEGRKVLFVEASGTLLASGSLVGEIAGVDSTSLLTVEVKGLSRTVRRYWRKGDGVVVTSAALGGAWAPKTVKVGASVHDAGLDVVSVTGDELRVERYRISTGTTWPLAKTFQVAQSTIGLGKTPKPWLVATSSTGLVVVGASGVGLLADLTGSSMQIVGEVDVSSQVSKPGAVALHSSGAMVVTGAKSGALEKHPARGSLAEP